MGNAAQAKATETGEKRQIEFSTVDGKTHQITCGNYIYQATAPGQFTLTFLEKQDRQAKDNEPIMVTSGVTGWRDLAMSESLVEVPAGEDEPA